MPVDFSRITPNEKSKRVFLIFSSDDMTILYVFLSCNFQEDIEIAKWITEHGYDENRIDLLDIENQ